MNRSKESSFVGVEAAGICEHNGGQEMSNFYKRVTFMSVFYLGEVNSVGVMP